MSDPTPPKLSPDPNGQKRPYLSTIKETKSFIEEDSAEPSTLNKRLRGVSLTLPQTSTPPINPPLPEVADTEYAVSVIMDLIKEGNIEDPNKCSRGPSQADKNSTESDLFAKLSKPQNHEMPNKKARMSVMRRKLRFSSAENEALLGGLEDKSNQPSYFG